MKKYLLYGMVFFGVLLLGACKKQEAEKSFWQETTKEADRITIKSKEEWTIDEEIAKTKIATESCACILQIQANNQRGSAILWEKGEEYWSFVTAAHVVEGCDWVRLMPLSQEENLEAFVHRIEGVDLAFLQVDTSRLEECFVGLVPVSKGIEPLECGKKIQTIGYDLSGEQSVYEGIVLEPWIYLEDFDNYMLLCECDAVPGMSGGAVFDETDCLVGMVCGENELGQLAVLPISVIEGEYDLFINY